MFLPSSQPGWQTIMVISDISALNKLAKDQELKLVYKRNATVFQYLRNDKDPYQLDRRAGFYVLPIYIEDLNKQVPS